MDDLEAIRADALAWANEVRRQHSLGPSLDALPAGIPNLACGCPLAKAIGGECAVLRGELILYFNDPETEDTSIGLPKAAVDFTIHFDAGRYPDLVAA